MNVLSDAEVVKPIEGMYAPRKVRQDLRQSFSRWLSHPTPHRFLVHQESAVDELQLLNLCFHYRVVYPGGDPGIATTWDASPDRVSEDAPSFEELYKKGWVFFDGGRWIAQRAPRGHASAVAWPSPTTKRFLEELSKPQLVARHEAVPADVRALAARLHNEEWLERRIPVREPEWVAGRLWQHMCPQGDLSTDANVVDKAFLDWLAWCEALASNCSWNIDWTATQMMCAREAAQRVLSRQLSGPLSTDLKSYGDRLQNAHAIPSAHLGYGNQLTDEPPTTLSAQVDWLASPNIAMFVADRFRNNSATAALNLLSSELELTDIGPDLDKVAAELFSFVACRPMALQQLLFRAQVEPKLLVDMLMNSAIAPVAIKVVIDWVQRRGRDTDRNAARDEQTKRFAIQDSVAFAAYHLNSGELNLEELAALVTWCHEVHGSRDPEQFSARRTVGGQLLRMVANRDEIVQTAVLQHLFEQAVSERNGRRVELSAILAAQTCFRQATNTASSPSVKLYAEFARDLNLDWTDTAYLSDEMAAQLVETALQQGGPEQEAFFVPFDIEAAINKADEGEQASSLTRVGQTLRTHIRLLARAVSGWRTNEIPAELSDALSTTVHFGAVEHHEQGWVGAITSRYSPSRLFGSERGSPAIDLAKAWRKLSPQQRGPLLDSVLNTNDPAFLAELSQHLPARDKSDVHARLKVLVPKKASKAWTWPEVQNRIKTLIDAGEIGLARAHYEATAPAPNEARPDFVIAFFILKLQLWMKEQNWTAIDSAAVPSSLKEATKQQAQNQLHFFQATSQLLRSNGRLEAARDVLERLSSQHGTGLAYKENFFAVSLQLLIGPRFNALSSDKKAAGESLLAEINLALGTDVSSARDSLAFNRAMLLVALDRPTEAFDTLAPWRSGTSTADFEFLAAVAMAAMGRVGEAFAILESALTEFGETDRLVRLRRELQETASFNMTAVSKVAVMESVDTLRDVRVALYQLTQLSPSAVGDLLGRSNEKLPGYLVHLVSNALQMLMKMSAMLRPRKQNTYDAKLENDLNTAIKHVLPAALSVPKWHVDDQSLGGTTPRGNPGERDIVISASSQEIAIYEALVCGGVEEAAIQQHLAKLYSYGSVGLYFLVVYAYTDKVQQLLNCLERLLKSEPLGELVDMKKLGPPDNAVRGHLAKFNVNHSPVVVAALVAELHIPRKRPANPS